MLLYHYTLNIYIPSILASRQLRPGPSDPFPGERRAVWCSTRRVWEPTVSRWALGMREVGGFRRIRVRPQSAPHDWAAYCRLSGAAEAFLRGLAMAGRRRGADPRYWRVSFEPIRIDDWIIVERWVPCGDDFFCGDWVRDEKACAVLEKHRAKL